MKVRVGPVLFAASIALAWTAAPLAAAPAKKPRPATAATTPKPQDDQSYLNLGPDPRSGTARPPNYVAAGQNTSVFRGTMVGGDATLGSGMPNPGLR
jgi:hypothetical protein